MGIISEAQSPQPVPLAVANPVKEYNAVPATTDPKPKSIMMSADQARLEGRKLVARATVTIHQPNVYRELTAMLKTPNVRIEQLVANATVHLVQVIDSAARQTGEEIDDRAHIAGAIGICAEVYDIAKEQSLFTMTDKQLQLSVSIAIEQYLKEEIAAGRIDKDKLKASFDQGVSEMTPAQKLELHRQLLVINRTAMGKKRRKRGKRRK